MVRNNHATLTQLLGILPRTVTLVSHLSAEFVGAKSVLNDIKRNWENNLIDSSLLTYFNITLPCGEKCPLNHATPLSCALDELREIITFNFKMHRVDTDSQVMKAEPFVLLSSENGPGRTCRRTYTGPPAVIYNIKTGCVTPLQNLPVSATSGLLIPPSSKYCITPLLSDPPNKYWRYRECLFDDYLKNEDAVQVKYGSDSNYVYCPYENITVYGTNLACPKSIFVLPSNVPFTVGRIDYTVNDLIVSRDFTLVPEWNHKINFHLLPAQRRMHLETGFNETWANINLIEKPSGSQSYVDTSDSVLIPWLLFIGSMIMYLVLICYLKRSRDKRLKSIRKIMKVAYKTPIEDDIESPSVIIEVPKTPPPKRSKPPRAQDKPM